MKAGISNIWILALMLVFFLVFAAYITISINYTASFKMKNEVLTIIEKHHGITTQTGSSVHSIIPGKGNVTGNVGTLETINIYLRGNHYTAKGDCNNEVNESKGGKGTWYGMKELNLGTVATSDYEPVQKDTKYYYCFAKYISDRFAGAGGLKNEDLKEYRYKFKMFFRFDVPALSEFLAIQVQGTTNPISHVKDTGKWEVITE